MRSQSCHRQSGTLLANLVRPVATASVLFALAGCAVGGGLEQATSSAQLVDDSVAQQAAPQGVAPTDADLIKRTVASVEDTGRTKPLAWQNPNTGSSGTIIAIETFMGRHGQRCRNFKTSVSTFMGIAFYDGEACQISPGEWVLSWFKSSD